MSTPAGPPILDLQRIDTFRGARHVLRAVSVDPSEQTADALERLARSFRLRQA